MKTRESLTRGASARSAPLHLAWLGVALVLGALVAWPVHEEGQGIAFARGEPGPNHAEPAGELEDVLAHQGEHDQRLAREANLVLDEILGPGRARVSVRSAWDFTRHTLTSEKPGRRVVLHESRTLAEPHTVNGAVDGAAAVREAKDYSAARSSEERVHIAPRLERLSVALFLDQGAPDSPELRAAIQAAVGFDAQRGDEFRTVVLPFARPEAATSAARPAPESPLAWVRRWSVPLAGALALALVWLASRGRAHRRSPPIALRAPEALARPPEPAPAARARVDDVLAADPSRVGAVLSRWAREEPAESTR